VGAKSRQKLVRRIAEGRIATIKPDEPWTSFQRAIGRDGSYQCWDGEYWFDIWKNSRYTVMTRVVRNSDENGPGMIHLSIKRNDKAPIANWRDLQKIKNELVGEECEGVQIFPAESRLVDSSNQYHLWVCSEPNFRLPFGYDERLVCEGNHHGAVQEPFEDHVRPDDLVPTDVMKEKHQEFLDRKNSGGIYADEIRKRVED